MTQSQMMLRSGSTASKGSQSSKSSMRVSSHKTMMEKFKKASGLDKTSTMSKEPEQRYMMKHIQVYQPKPPTEIAELLQLFYSVAMEDPANLADTIHKLHEEYKQNPKKSEQFCILHAFGEKYHLTHSFTFAPDNWKDSDNAQIKEHHGKPILFTGFESEVGRDLLTLTADPADLFGLKTKQLASWDACCKLTEGFAATDDETAKTVGAFPFLPIIGRDWCAKVANGLYPMDISKSWTPSQLIACLKEYAVACDSSRLVKTNIQNTIRCLASKDSNEPLQCQAAIIAAEIKVKLEEPFIAAHLKAMQATFRPTVSLLNDDPASNKEQPSSNKQSQEQSHSTRRESTLGQEQHHSSEEPRQAQEQHSIQGHSRAPPAQQQQQQSSAITTTGADLRRNLFDHPPTDRGDSNMVEDLPEPFTKVPATVTLAKLTCLRGWTRSPTWNHIDGFWVNLLALCKHDRALWFTNLVRNLREAHPKTFSSKFAYSATFQQHMYDAILTSPQNDVTWWCGLVGGQLALSEEAIAEAHHLDSNFIAFGSQMNLSNNQATAKRTGRCPPVPKTIAGLLAFIERVAFFTAEFASRSMLHAYARQLAQALEEWQPGLAANPQWINQKAGEVIYTLVLIEREEFSRTYQLDDFVDDDGQETEPCYPMLPSQVPQQAFTLLQSNPCYPPDALPKALKPTPTQEHSASTATGVGSSRTSQNDAEIRRLRRELDRERARGQNNNSKKRKEPTGAGPNPRQASGFQEFFAQLPEEKSKKGLSVLLQNGGSTPPQTLKTLDLSMNTCLRWIVAGRCVFPHCSRQHPDTVPDPEKVKKVVATLTQGANKL